MSEKNVKARSCFQGRFIAEQKDGSALEAFGIRLGSKRFFFQGGKAYDNFVGKKK